MAARGNRWCPTCTLTVNRQRSINPRARTRLLRHFIAGANPLLRPTRRSPIEGGNRGRSGSSRRRSNSIRVRRDACGRTSTHMVRNAFRFCVRTVSHTPRNPGHTLRFTGKRRRASMLREVVDRKCVGGIWCASARVKGINFQACSFTHSDRQNRGIFLGDSIPPSGAQAFSSSHAPGSGVAPASSC